MQQMAQLEGVELVACHMTVQMMKIKEDKLIVGVPVWTAEEFLKYARDCKITSIYEGTSGIQAMDLLARREHSRWELRHKVTAAGATGDIADEVLDQLCDRIISRLEARGRG